MSFDFINIYRFFFLIYGVEVWKCTDVQLSAVLSAYVLVNAIFKC